MSIERLFQIFGLIVVVSPAILCVLLGLTMLAGRTVSERIQALVIQVSVLTGLTAATSILLLMLLHDRRNVPVEFGNLVNIPSEHFHFHLKFVFDRLSVPFAILSFVLCGTVGAFANVYLHREPGYSRFFMFYALFLLGMVVSSLAGTIETLFLGWELVGLSSALLVAFFHERPRPVRNGQQIWTVYRVADAAFLIAALSLHHLTGGGDFAGLMGTGSWPDGQAAISSQHAFLVGVLLLVAALGKSGMVPFSGWLPRAMEGPTPSSAIFYGALSVHLGAYLLLRVSPLLEISVSLSLLVVVFGLLSAIFGTLASRVQTDVKSALAFASLTQVGIIFVEIGIGFRYLALIHIIGHACLRTLQLLRAPSVIKDHQLLTNAIGQHPSTEGAPIRHLLPQNIMSWLYRWSLERGYLDGLLNEFVVQPFLATFRWCDKMERRWTNFLSGLPSNEMNVPPDPGDPQDDQL